jgi:PPM family protein phosphatase
MNTPEDQVPQSRVRKATPRVQAAAATHVGARAVNADAFVRDDAAGLFAVADGLGDRPRSRLAADMALVTVREAFGSGWLSYPPEVRPVEEGRERLVMGVESAHQRLCAPWWASDERLQTTFAGVVVCGESLVLGHVGDSRVYLLRASKGRIAQQTDDHTVLCAALRRGTPGDVATALPDANALTQALGSSRRMDVRALVRHWEPGDLVLVCTDGLSDLVAPEAMTEVALGVPDLATAAQQLVDQAVANGGRDNVTAVLVRHEATPSRRVG